MRAAHLGDDVEVLVGDDTRHLDDVLLLHVEPRHLQREVNEVRTEVNWYSMQSRATITFRKSR